jgi:uncharacterized membrane protein
MNFQFILSVLFGIVLIVFIFRAIARSRRIGVLIKKLFNPR